MEAMVGSKKQSRTKKRAVKPKFRKLAPKAVESTTMAKAKEPMVTRKRAASKQAEYEWNFGQKKRNQKEQPQVKPKMKKLAPLTVNERLKRLERMMINSFKRQDIIDKNNKEGLRAIMRVVNGEDPQGNMWSDEDRNSILNFKDLPNEFEGFELFDEGSSGTKASEEDQGEEDQEEED